MLRNKSLPFLLLGLVACTQKPTPETMISRWDKVQSGPSALERKLASSPKKQCLQDIFTVETLQEEVRELERLQASGQRVQGQWKHLDLSQLPVPQANFLKSYGNKIGDLSEKDSIDYSSCDDVPCIINKIYGKEDHVAGYVHYLWYLKFGHYLSADNLVPGGKPGNYNDQDVALSEFLYDEKELYAFWRLSLMLPPAHTTLTRLDEVQRLPRGHHFEDKDRNGNLIYHSLVCGLASSGGWIKLKDSCLTVSDSNKDMGYFYVAVTHELSHHVDFEGGSNLKLSYRSHDLDYGELSGFNLLREWVEWGRIRREWKLKENYSKLPSNYGGGSPQENFAEALARFRVEGDDNKKRITEAHYNFVSKEYYQNQAYDAPSLYQAWLRSYSSETSREVFKAVVDCSKNSAGVRSSYFRAADFSDPLTPGMLNCIGAKAAEISSYIGAKVKLYEPDGCEGLGATTSYGGERKRTNWEAAAREHLIGQFNQYLQELKKDKNYLARIQEYYEQLADKAVARNSYLECYEEEGEEACYESAIRHGALEKARSLNLPEEQTKELAEMYVTYHPYSKTKQDVLNFYHRVVNSNEELLRNKGDEVWAACRDMSHNDEQPPTGSIFQVGDGYMISSFYNCLNAQLPDVISDIARSINFEGAKLQHSKEEVLLAREIGPGLSKYLREVYKNEKESEAKTVRELLAQDKGKLRKDLLRDFSWVKSVVDSEQIQIDCKAQALSLVSFDPLYHTKRELFGDLANSSCSNISGSHEFNQWLESSKGEFNEKITSGLEDKLMVLAEAQARECIKQYPVDTNLNRIRYKRQREKCLTDAWPGLEDKVLTEAQNDPLVKKFKTDMGHLRVKLESSRRRLQIRIFKEHFN